MGDAHVEAEIRTDPGDVHRRLTDLAEIARQRGRQDVARDHAALAGPVIAEVTGTGTGVLESRIRHPLTVD